MKYQIDDKVFVVYPGAPYRVEAKKISSVYVCSDPKEPTTIKYGFEKHDNWLNGGMQLEGVVFPSEKEAISYRDAEIAKELEAQKSKFLGEE